VACDSSVMTAISVSLSMARESEIVSGKGEPAVG